MTAQTEAQAALGMWLTDLQKSLDDMQRTMPDVLARGIGAAVEPPEHDSSRLAFIQQVRNAQGADELDQLLQQRSAQVGQDQAQRDYVTATRGT